MRRWWIWITLLLVMTLGIRLLADSQQASQIRKLHVAHAAVSDAHPTNEDTSTPHDDWRGKTGLSSSDERRFIRYLHLKLGEQDNDPSALQAEDLTYLGAYDQDEGVVRYWLLPPGYSALYGTITRIEGGLWYSVWPHLRHRMRIPRMMVSRWSRMMKVNSIQIANPEPYSCPLIWASIAFC